MKLYFARKRKWIWNNKVIYIEADGAFPNLCVRFTRYLP